MCYFVLNVSIYLMFYYFDVFSPFSIKLAFTRNLQANHSLNRQGQQLDMINLSKDRMADYFQEYFGQAL